MDEYHHRELSSPNISASLLILYLRRLKSKMAEEERMRKFTLRRSEMLHGIVALVEVLQFHVLVSK